MTGSIQASAIDDSFETLTNAPDAWVSGRQAAPPPVDYQHYVEAGDERSAVDDRCFTEYGAVEFPHYATTANTTGQKRHSSRQTSSKPSSRGKRRPSPSFVIRGRNGESVVQSNPFMLRKSSRAHSKAPSSAKSEQAESDSNRSSTYAQPRTFKIRIRGKNGEEVIQEIRRPLHFASGSGSRDTTAVAGDEEAAEVKYWVSATDPPTESDDWKRRGRRDRRQCKFYVHIRLKSANRPYTAGLVPSADFITKSRSASTEDSSATGNSLKMSGALPSSSSPAITITPHSSRSHLLPPEKPLSSSAHHSVTNIDEPSSTSNSSRHGGEQNTQTYEDPSLQVSHHSTASSKRASSHCPRQRVLTVPDDSLEDLMIRSKLSRSSHASTISPSISFSEPPLSAAQVEDPRASEHDNGPLQSASNKSDSISSRASSARRSSSSRTSTSKISRRSIATDHQLEDVQEDSGDVFSPTVSLAKQESSKKAAYYSWRAPKDSLYSASSKHSDSGSLLSFCRSAVSEKSACSSKKSSDSSGGVHLSEAVTSMFSARSSATSEKSRHSSTPREHTPQRSSSPESSRDKEPKAAWAQETASEKTERRSHRSHLSTHITQHSASANPYEGRSSSHGARLSTLSAIDESVHDEQEEQRPMSGWKTHSQPSSLRESDREVAGWEEHSAAHSSRKSRRSKSHQSRSSQDQPPEEVDQSHDEWVTAKRSAASSKSKTFINIEEDLLEYLPPAVVDERLLPPMPLLTTIHEEPESSNLSLVPTMSTQGTTRYARPGAITPHPLSDISSVKTARKPPSVEPQRLEYQRPFVESGTDSDFSKPQSSTRRSSRPRLLEEQAYHSAREDRYSHRDEEGLLHHAKQARKRRAAERASQRT